MPTIEKVTATEGCLLGEGPHWDASTQSLYFVDVFGKGIVKYTPATNRVSKSSFEKRPFCIIPIENRKNEFVMALGNKLVQISWNGDNEQATILQTLCAVDASKTFNDAKCDSSGRLWTGSHAIDPTDITKSLPVGSLYSFNSAKQLTHKVDKIRVSNGIAFNEKTKKMFYIDTLKYAVDRFDFDITTGTISNRQVWFTFAKSNVPGGPDGMTIDIDGNLWVAAMRGGRIIKIDGNKPETLLQSLDMPAEQVTSLTFGGKNLDELYATTGNVVLRENGPKSTANGAIIKVTGLGTRGLPAVSFKLD